MIIITFIVIIFLPIFITRTIIGIIVMVVTSTHRPEALESWFEPFFKKTWAPEVKRHPNKTYSMKVPMLRFNFTPRQPLCDRHCCKRLRIQALRYSGQGWETVWEIQDLLRPTCNVAMTRQCWQKVSVPNPKPYKTSWSRACVSECASRNPKS